MQTNKKTLSLLITALLALSMILAAVPLASATVTVALAPSTGYVGSKVVVSGTSTSPGGLIQVYWDSVKAWDGAAGFLAESYAVGTSYSITIVVPETVAGTHYVIVKDVEASEIQSAQFTVQPSVILSPTKVLAGDTINVTAQGFAASANAIVLYTPTDDSNDTLTGTWAGNGGSGTLANTPVKPGFVSITYANGTITLVIIDDSEGKIRLDSASGNATDVSVSGTIDYTTGAIAFSITPALTGDITKSVTYTYYSASVKVPLSTSNLGSFATSFTVPSTESPGTKTVISLDGKGNTNSTTFEVVSSIITLTPTKGYRGSTGTVAGRGFTAGQTVDIRWYLTVSEYITVVDDYPVASDGTFSTTFTVPSVGDPVAPGSVYTVSAYEGTTFKASTTFTVIAPAKITLNPVADKAGQTISVTGEWFSADSKITLKFGDIALSTTPTLVLTGSTGSFSATFTVPNVAVGNYTVTATDAKGVSATATFTVVVPVTEIRTRSTTYVQGDQVSIYVKSTEPIAGIKLVITDPSKIVFWQYTIQADDVASAAGFNYLAWTVSFPQLPDDAPTGNWNFTAYDGSSKIVATNLFTVVEKATLTSVQAQINALSDKITSLEGKVNALDLSGINSQLSSINSQISSISGAASSAASAANSAKSAADAAKASADSALSVIEDAKTAAQSAANAANAAKSSADSAVSAIEDATTAAESAKAAAEGVSMAVWIAVVLSLVAAIAAIFAVITIRGKIAG